MAFVANKPRVDLGNGTRNKHNASTLEEKKLANISVKNMRKLAKTQRQRSVQPSEPDVALVSTPTDAKLSVDSVAKCSLLFIEALSKQWLNSDLISLTLLSAQHKAKELNIKDADEVFTFIVKAFNGNRSQSIHDFMG